MINLKNRSRITRNEKWQLRMHRPRPDFPKSIVHHVFHIKFCCCKVPFRNVRNCYLSFQRDLAHSARETADTPHRHPLLSRPKNPEVFLAVQRRYAGAARQGNLSGRGLDAAERVLRERRKALRQSERVHSVRPVRGCMSAAFADHRVLADGCKAF